MPHQRGFQGMQLYDLKRRKTKQREKYALTIFKNKKWLLSYYIFNYFPEFILNGVMHLKRDKCYHNKGRCYPFYKEAII